MTTPRQLRPTRWRARTRTVGMLVSALLGLSTAHPALAQGFGASISPPRFELQLKPGQTLRQVIDIQHVGLQAGRFRVYTNDWTLQADGSVAFSEALAPDSCRPWVALERRELSVEPNARYRYRFELSAPTDAAVRECRFAIMVEGVDPARVAQANLNIPVGGRIAVIVYAAIGGAAPRLEVTAHRVAQVNGRALPVLEVRNTGNAHGRMEGFLNGADAAGQDFELSPSDLPILPGASRTVPLMPVTEERKPLPPIQYPFKVKGTLEWGAQRVPLEHTFTQ